MAVVKLKPKLRLLQVADSELVRHVNISLGFCTPVKKYANGWAVAISKRRVIDSADPKTCHTQRFLIIGYCLKRDSCRKSGYCLKRVLIKRRNH